MDLIDDKFDFGFAVDWMRKDLKIAMDGQAGACRKWFI